MNTAALRGEQHVLLRDVAWETYLALAENTNRPGRLITYCRGEMEIMSPSKNHEIAKSVLAQMVQRYAAIREIDIASTASTTFQRASFRQGFEADESFYIEHESVVRQRTEIDLQIDPPPDLVIEIEQSRSAINKLLIFAAFGIPEVWRYNGSTLWMGRLTGSEYAVVTASAVLPGFPVSLAIEILGSIGTESETRLIRRFAEQCA